MKTTFRCEKCYKLFDDKELCFAHEASCKDYKTGNRVEVFYQEKWWPGIITTIFKASKCEHCGGKKERFMAVRTDEQFDHNVDGLFYTGYDMGIWERTGDKNHVRSLVKQTPV